MIDIHTHILPGIDDGSEVMKDSIRMARIAYESGTDTLIVTPHCNIENMFENYYDEKLVERFCEFEKEVQKENIPLKIHLGMEIYGTEEVPDLLQRGKLTTLNQSKYLLIEFSFRKDLLLIDFLINEITCLGLVPIIAHPERYPYVQKHPDIVYEWIDQGCLMQINKGSIMGNFGFSARNTAMYLLEYGLVDFVASDSHSPLQRTPDLSKVYQFLRSKYSDDYAKVLFEDNPRCVIENHKIINSHKRRITKYQYI